MPVNIPGILVPFHLLFNPRLVIPHVVKDIRQIDFIALRKAGYRGAVFDKDNCLTVPYQDELVPELQEGMQVCVWTGQRAHTKQLCKNQARRRQRPGRISIASPVSPRPATRHGLSVLRVHKKSAGVLLFDARAW
ncbi:hypothetical protein SERLADRAFT_436234 [Serpula lacrymans var. lacrymans S7.9]|uniref:Uncharacterized protein n=1 Tax=Serpula lacrymans var. lacrymans (strain S7.9) TaxID=578457 RepID=F8NSB1_SERL9|nr:uncharacterized protein SERLADRAFT_436234 [Serpula lacrymans var. lacrymans S7.9]EGO26420.1 hypothetical protein SERLADRAFT_436234 [Serpula lacrymans var. lacrymans S7.9]